MNGKGDGVNQMTRATSRTHIPRSGRVGEYFFQKYHQSNKQYI
jgi:hypothetical protein